MSLVIGFSLFLMFVIAVFLTGLERTFSSFGFKLEYGVSDVDWFVLRLLRFMAIIAWVAFVIGFVRWFFVV